MSKKNAEVEIVEISPAEVAEKIKGGSFVTVTFIKRDNTVRVLNGRTGVSKGVKGVGMAYDAKAKGIIILYEANRPEDPPTEKYRAVRLDSVISIKADGKKFVVKKD